MSEKKSASVKPDIIGLTANLIVWGIRQFKGQSIMDVIDAVKLESKDGKKPGLIKEHSTDTGKEFIFSLPPGVDQTDFEKNKHYFESYLNSSIDIVQNGRRLTLKTFTAKFPEKIPFNFDPSKYPEMLAPIPIGVTINGELRVVDMASVYHMLAGGATGYGKTSGLLGITTSLLLKGCQVSAIDKKALDFPLLEDYLEVAIEEDEIISMLRKTVKEMERRTAILRERKVQKIQQTKGIPYKVLIIDEAADIESAESWELIDKLVRKARSSGIGLILATQKPSANTAKGFTDIRSNLSGRLCYYVNGDSNDSQVVLGKGNSKGSELPAARGRCIWRWQTEEILQSMFLDADKAIEILKANNVPLRRVEDEYNDSSSKGIKT